MSPLKGVTLVFVLLLGIATIGPFLFGYHLSELNAPKAVITCEKKSSSLVAGSGLPQCIRMDSAQLGLVSSMFTLGGLCGALAAGPSSSSYGRLKTMLATTIFHILGPVFEALSTSIAILTFGRFLSGVGAGAALVVVPIYIAELSPPQEKGFFGAFTQVTTNLGILTTQVLGLFLSRGQYWRIILAVAGAFGVAQLVGLLLAGKESPKYIADQGDVTKARRVLRAIRGRDADIDAEIRGWGVDDDSANIQEESALLDDTNAPNSSSESHGGDSHSTSQNVAKSVARQLQGPFAVFKDSDSRRAVLVVMTVMLGQQLTGINSVVMYGVDVLAGLLAANSALLNVAVAALNVIITVASAPLTDRYGRKTCLLLSVSVMGISALCLGVSMAKHVPVLSGVSVVTFVSGFALAVGPIPFILASELVNPEAVSSTQAWALAANWISTFFVAQFFPIVNEKLGGGKTYFIFAAIAVLFIAFITFFLPESKGKANADEVWGRKRLSSDREDR